MQFTGDYTVPAPCEKVWAALNDPEILRVCIEGCEELAWSAKDQLKAVIRAKVGPISAKFSGKLWLTDVVPSRSYTLNGQGEGGAAGFVKGFASVELETLAPQSCRLHYRCETNIGGILADVGSKLVQGVADRTAGEFFDRFTRRLIVAMAADSKAAEDKDLGRVDQDLDDGLALFSGSQSAEQLLADIDSLLDDGESVGSIPAEPASQPSQAKGRSLPRPILSLANPSVPIVAGGMGLFGLIVLLLAFGG